MYFKKNLLMRWGAVAGSIVFCGIAWYVSVIALQADAGSVDSGQAANAQKTVESVRLHDEVQYFGHKFADEQQRLQKQSDVAHVQAF